MFLDIGGSPFDFWEYTPAEIRDLVESFNRVYTQKKKEEIISKKIFGD
nr:MAG TPA: tail assembly chaperone protein [Caudoviricetes sp.]